MAPKGKKAAVQEGSFLQFLRSVGYTEDLPPSTVAWLESAPAFKFLASKLGKDNFVSAKDQQEYNEIMMAKCPNADLYDALGSCSDDDDAEQQQDQQPDADTEWMGAVTDADVQRQVQVRAATMQHTAAAQQSRLCRECHGLWCCSLLVAWTMCSAVKGRKEQQLTSDVTVAANNRWATANPQLSKPSSTTGTPAVIWHLWHLPGMQADANACCTVAHRPRSRRSSSWSSTSLHSRPCQASWRHQHNASAPSSQCTCHCRYSTCKATHTRTLHVTFMQL